MARIALRKRIRRNKRIPKTEDERLRGMGNKLKKIGTSPYYNLYRRDVAYCNMYWSKEQQSIAVHYLHSIYEIRGNNLGNDSENMPSML